MNPEALAPKLSIVVLTRDRCGLLRQCLVSLLAQDASAPLEIVVVDDGSVDTTRIEVERLAASHPTLLYEYQEPRGIPAARNAGMRRASAELIGFVADDYTLPPHYAASVLQFFTDHPDASAVRFAVEAAGDDLRSRVSHFYYDVDVRKNLDAVGGAQPKTWSQQLRRIWRKLPTANSPTATHSLPAAAAAVFRRQVFETLGGFDEQLLRVEDSEFADRMRQHDLKLYFEPRLTFRRRYEKSLWRELRATARNSFFIARYQRRSRPDSGSVARQVGANLGVLFGGPIWRARQAASWREFAVFLPFMFVFELGACAGRVLEAWTPVPARSIEADRSP